MLIGKSIDFEIKTIKTGPFSSERYIIYCNGKDYNESRMIEPFKTLGGAQNHIDYIADEYYPFYKRVGSLYKFCLTPVLLPPPIFTYRIIREKLDIYNYVLEKSEGIVFFPVYSNPNYDKVERSMELYMQSDCMVENKDGIPILNKFLTCLYVDISGNVHTDIPRSYSRLSGAMIYNIIDINSLNYDTQSEESTDIEV